MPRTTWRRRYKDRRPVEPVLVIPASVPPAFAAWLEALLAEYPRREMSAAGAQAYYDDLQAFPLDELTAAAKALRQRGLKFFPGTAELCGEIRRARAEAARTRPLNLPQTRPEITPDEAQDVSAAFAALKARLAASVALPLPSRVRGGNGSPRRSEASGHSGISPDGRAGA